MKLYRLTFAPCRHDRAGRPHTTMSSRLRCAQRYGIPRPLLAEDLEFARLEAGL